MIKLKDLLKESSPGFTDRKFGDPLPTFKGIMKKYKQVYESRFKAKNGQGINAKVSEKDGETYVEYYPKDWGVLLTVELLEAMIKKLGKFRLSTSAGIEREKTSDVKDIKGTKDGLWRGKITIQGWDQFR
jgi:hypothetical protein